MNYKIKENSLLARIAAAKLRTNRVALVWGKTIHLFNTSKEEFISNKRWLRHEMAHMEQYQRYGLLKFLCLYTWYSIRYGYFNNPLEIEAREKENEAQE
jgi:hypothetical protein